MFGSVTGFAVTDSQKCVGDATGDIRFSVFNKKTGRTEAGSFTGKSDALAAANKLEDEKGTEGQETYFVHESIASPSRPISRGVYAADGRKVSSERSFKAGVDKAGEQLKSVGRIAYRAGFAAKDAFPARVFRKRIG